MKEGIIVVNPGTMNSDIHTRCIEELVLSIKDRLEDAEVVHVYTNGDIRKRLREETGEKVQNLKAAILGMKEKGVTHLTVLTTDVFESEDFVRLKEETGGLAGLFIITNIAGPLISEEEDYEITARAVRSAFGDIVGDDILLLVSGTAHPAADEIADRRLQEFEKSIRKYIPNTYVATLHGARKPYKVIKEIKPMTGARVVLAPLEYIAGEGIENSVSEEYPGLVARLEAEGFVVEGVFNGIAEYEDFLRLYLRRLYAARRQ